MLLCCRGFQKLETSAVFSMRYLDMKFHYYSFITRTRAPLKLHFTSVILSVSHIKGKWENRIHAVFDSCLVLQLLGSGSLAYHVGLTWYKLASSITVP